ncbi:PaaI family thioesterase [Hydrogenophaga sp. 2FB]|uniref:PaaI family thioesterase n=1 Tax=Hydrogenophaga sp. 2FB TaxID=2502187 RepID=UPI0010F748F9|nr:PaaI family thioesterase [Hydrogenophaga sp. 2FB]
MTDEHTRIRLEATNWTVRTLKGFIEQAGPLWTRREDGGWAYGLLCDATHLNPAARMHGGALVTLLDHAISTVAWEACERAPCVTLQLDTQFLGAVREGEFAEARAGVSHKTGGLVFMRGAVTVDGQPVLMAQAILKVLPTTR